MESLQNRVSCCRIIGHLCKFVDGRIIENNCLPLALSLCQDTATEVRVTMCSQLATLARSIGYLYLLYISSYFRAVESAKYVLPEILELLKDEEIEVRLCAYESFVSLLDFFDRETRQTKMIPFLKTIHKEFLSEMIVVIAKHFGPVLHTVYSILLCVVCISNYFRR